MNVIIEFSIDMHKFFFIRTEQDVY